MTLNEPLPWGANDRAWHVASQNIQLLAMLEVLQDRTVADRAHLVGVTRLTLAFPAQVSPAERGHPIDPGGRTRAALLECCAKARAIRLRSPEIDALADACENLRDWLATHDRNFEDPAPSAPMSLETA